MSRILLVVGCGLLLGCGGAGDGKSSYSGTVTWNGTPIPSGTVTFMSPTGQVDSTQIVNGAFTLRSEAGIKVVTVTAERELGSPPPTERMPNPPPVKHQYIPREFNVDSKLSETLSDSHQKIALELSGTEVPPPKNALAAAPE